MPRVDPSTICQLGVCSLLEQHLANVDGLTLTQALILAYVASKLRCLTM